MRAILILIGGGLACVAIGLSWAGDPQAATLTWPLAVAGGVYLLTGIMLSRLPDVFGKVALAMIMMFFMVAAIEAGCRFIGLDFNRTNQAWQRNPIFYRQPIEPIGEAFFRRPGPDEWTGKVLTAGAARVNVVEPTFADEQVLTFRYDSNGFRNPPDLKDWQIVVVGDSFTELGYLRDEDLFTTILSQRLGVRVKNLGVGSTGPLTHACYLRHYGKAPSTQQAVLVFFEGNDVKDFNEERQRLEDFKKTGKKPSRDLESKRQTSFLVALATAVTAEKKQPGSTQNAIAKWETHEQPVTLTYNPPDPDQLDADTQQALDAAVRDWATVSKELGMTPWLAYMPCKRRVLHDVLVFNPDTPRRHVEWKPNQLPQHIERLCQTHGIRFIDLTPALIEQTDREQMTYNPLWDTHLNQHGSQVVAETLAEHLRAAFDASAPDDQAG